MTNNANIATWFNDLMPILVGGRPLPGFVGTNPAEACPPLVSVVYSQTEVSASGWSLVQKSPTDCGVPECDRVVSKMRRTWPTRVCCAMGKGKDLIYMYVYTIRKKLVHLYQRIYSLAENGPSRLIHTEHTTGENVAPYYVVVAIQYTIWVSLYFTQTASSNHESYQLYLCQFTVAGSTTW